MVKQAGAELGQAQVKLEDIVVIVVEVVVKAIVEVEVQLLFRVGGWWDKAKLILYCQAQLKLQLQLNLILS